MEKLVVLSETSVSSSEVLGEKNSIQRIVSSRLSGDDYNVFLAKFQLFLPKASSHMKRY